MNEKYIPLYRKYRPQMLEEIVGQEHIKKALTNAITLDKISHAYLFTGPRGTGKTSTARIFAKSLNCQKGPTENPCGECENCINITNSIPIDVIEIDAASNRKVEDAQNILGKVLNAPVNSKYKIYIIDEVHMLSTTAFNALLKTLEEPPKNVIFILATTEVHKVLDTIKSRCQRFDFKRITTEDIVNHLKEISKKEKINITDDALFAIAKNSAGGMRDSIALLDQLSVLGSKNAINNDDINNLLGRLSFDTLSSLTDKIISSNPQSAIEELENIYNSGNEPVQILTNLLDYLKNLLIVKNCREVMIYELTQANKEQIKVLKEQSEKIETHQIIFLMDKSANYIKEVRLTNNPRLWLEVAIIDMANLTENTSLIELQNRISRLENGNPQPVQVAQYKTPPTPVLKPEIKSTPVQKIEPKTEEIQSVVNKIEEVTTEVKNEPVNESKEEFTPMPKAQPVEHQGNIDELWNKLLENIQSAPTRALLKQWAEPVSIMPENIVIAIKSEVFLKQFADGNKRQMLINAADTMFGQTNSNITVRLPLPEDEELKKKSVISTPAPAPFKKTVEKQQEEEITAEEIEELQEEIVEEQIVDAVSQKVSAMHSDQVNMIIDLFDGRVMDQT